MKTLDPERAFLDAGLDAAVRLGYSDHGDIVGGPLRMVLRDGSEERARRIWAAAFPRDPDSVAVIMADAREARAAADRRAALRGAL